MPNEKNREPIVVTHDGGVRFSAHIRSHRLIVDQPQASGGLSARNDSIVRRPHKPHDEFVVTCRRSASIRSTFAAYRDGSRYFSTRAPMIGAGSARVAS